jgi:hypothetical protein
MHHARLAGFIIDCKTDDLDTAAEFWSAALGYELKPRAEQVAPRYRELMTGDGLHIEVQQVEHDSRVHLDIESDGLGAKRIGNVHTWVVMEAPTGQRFCVVRPQRPGIDTPENLRH